MLHSKCTYNITIVICVLTLSKQGTEKFSRESQCKLQHCKAKHHSENFSEHYDTEMTVFRM